MKARRLARRGGFTLLETVFAVGIAVTILVAVLALAPVGLLNMQMAQTRESEASILQVLAGQYQMRPWNELRELERGDDHETFFFDGEGYELRADGDERIFTARVKVLAPPKLPGADAPESNDREKFSRRLEISIDPRPLPEEQLFLNKAAYRTYNILIVNTGNDG